MHANEHPKPDLAPWREQAACRGMAPAIFFPGKNHPAIKAALAVCAYCPVRTPCHDEAIIEEAAEPNTTPCGIRGGATAHERRMTIRLRRRIQRAS